MSEWATDEIEKLSAVSRDMCPHGWNLREQFCPDCSSAEKLRERLREQGEELGEVVLKMRALERDARTTTAELAALRLIVTEKFAGADLYVKPEDAADLARWAANPGAVRQLMKIAPTFMPDAYDQREQCSTCRAEISEAHDKGCVTAAAWRALGDPRGAQDIERAHEESLREQERRRRDLLPYTNGEWVDASRSNPFVRMAEALAATHETGGLIPPRPLFAPRCLRQVPFAEGQHRLCSLAGGHDGDCVPGSMVFRLASESQQAAQARQMSRVLNLQGAEVEVPFPPRPPTGFSVYPPRHPGALPYVAPDAMVVSRHYSDARGMVAVEDEARELNALTPEDTTGIAMALAR